VPCEEIENTTGLEAAGGRFKSPRVHCARKGGGKGGSRNTAKGNRKGFGINTRLQGWGGGVEGCALCEKENQGEEGPFVRA